MASYIVDNTKLGPLVDDVIEVPCTPHEILAPLVTVVPLQPFAYHYAVLRGFDSRQACPTLRSCGLLTSSRLS